MSKQAKRKRGRPRQPVILYVLLGLLALIGVAILVVGIGLLIYTLTRGLWANAAQALLIILGGGAVPVMFGNLVWEGIQARREQIKAYELKQKQIPYVQAWRAALLNPNLQPHGDAVVELDMEAAVARDDFWDLSREDVDRIRELNLQLYKDPREGGSRWIGQINTADPTHSWWWYAEHPHKPGHWRAAEHEFAAVHGKPSMPQTAPGKKVVYLLSALLFENQGSHEASLGLIRTSLPERTDIWLRHFIQTFGHARPEIIRYTPAQVRWDEAHQILHHYAAWQATNDAADLPQELALRMVGLAALVDRFELNELLPHEEAQIDQS